MPKNTEQFQDIVIHIGEQKNNSYSIRLRESPWGEAQVSLDNVGFEKLKRLNSILEDTYEKFLEIQGDSKAIRILSKRFGKELFDAIFHDDIRRKLDKSFGAAHADNITLRILLQVESREFSDLNLELLYDNGMPHLGDAFLSRGRKTILTRYPVKQTPDNNPLHTRKLKILVVVSSPKDLQALNSNTEKDSLTKTLRKKSELPMRFLRLTPTIEVDYLENATYAKLESKIDEYQPQIIHFVGHAGYKDHEPSLVLETEGQLSDYVFGERAWRLFRNEDNPIQFVFLNACQSFHLCQELVSQYGISMVIGTKYPVYDRVAVDFTAKLYACILDKFSVDHAVREAREITLRVDEFQWMAYVLAMHKKDGKFFEFSLAPELKIILEQVWSYISDLGSEVKEVVDAALQGLINLGKSVVGLLLMVVETAQMQLKQRNGATEALGEIMDATGDTLPVEPLSNVTKKTDEPIPLRHEALKALFKSDSDEAREQITSIWFDPHLDHIIDFRDSGTDDHSWVSSKIVQLLFKLKKLQNDIERLNQDTNKFSQQAMHITYEKKQLLNELNALNQYFANWNQSIIRISSLLEKQSTKVQEIEKVLNDNENLGKRIEESEKILFDHTIKVMKARTQNIEEHQKLKIWLRNHKALLDTLEQEKRNTNWNKILMDRYEVTQEKIDVLAIKLNQLDSEKPELDIDQFLSSMTQNLSKIIGQSLDLGVQYEKKGNHIIAQLQNRYTKCQTWGNLINQAGTLAQEEYVPSLKTREVSNLVERANRLIEQLNIEKRVIIQDFQILMEILNWDWNQRERLKEILITAQKFQDSLATLSESSASSSPVEKPLSVEALKNIDISRQKIGENFLPVVEKVWDDINQVMKKASAQIQWLDGHTIIASDGQTTLYKREGNHSKFSR